MKPYPTGTKLKLALAAAVVVTAVAGCAPGDASDLLHTVVVPRAWFVATTGDDGNDCLAIATPCRKIGTAIERAAAGDQIFIEPGTYREFNTHMDGAFVIDKNIALLGDGPDANAVHLDGGGVRPVVVITERAHPNIENLTIQNGGGIGRGVAVLDNAGLTLYRVVIQDNSGEGVFFTGAVGTTLQLDESRVRRNGNGGLQLGPGSTTIEGSRIVDNTGPGIATGGGFLTIRDTTIARNRFDSNGEGLWISEGTTVRVDNSTFSGHVHVAIFNDGVLTLVNTTVSGNGIGITNWRDLSLIHSTIAYNIGQSLDDSYATRLYLRDSIVLKVTASDCRLSSGMEIVLDGNDLACWSASDGDLMLGPLADNGGPTQTLALLAGSPAIDAAGEECVGVATDQRGEPRPAGSQCDIGAFEVQPELGEPPRPTSIATISAGGVPFPQTVTPTAGNPADGEGYEDVEEAHGALFQNGNCHTGPAAAYPVVTSLLKGTTVPLEGRNSEHTWWWALLPSGGHCWLSGAVVSLSGNVLDLPIITAPPLQPTATHTSAPSKPAAPQNLSITGRICQSPTYSVTLGWADMAGNETSYRVYRDGNLIATLGANATTYTDSPPGSGPYVYGVEASNAAGASSRPTVNESGCVM